MNCPDCKSANIGHLSKTTTLGYQRYQCRQCRRTFNERTRTLFNELQFPTDMVLLVVLWRLRYRLGLRDLAEMFLERGFEFTHEAVRDWEAKFAPLVEQRLRTKRRGKAGVSWYVDETYIKVKGKWRYHYRAIDRDGNLIDSMLSAKRDTKAAKRFFKRALGVVGHLPERVTSDGYHTFPKAIDEELDEKVVHRVNRYLNNRLEQDHRGIKQRTKPMLGFKNFFSAARFCTAYDELRNYLRPRYRCCENLSLATRRKLHQQRWSDLMNILQAA